MAQTLQHGQTAQRSWIQAAGAGEHRPDGPETVNALAMKMDQFVGADQRSFRYNVNTLLKILYFLSR